MTFRQCGRASELKCFLCASTGLTTKRFVGHDKDVLSVSFSADNRQIVSGSRDKTIKLWNTLGECKYEIKDEGHSEWVSCVRFSPNPLNPVIVSAGWDKVVKVRSAFIFESTGELSRRCHQGDDQPFCTTAICYFRGASTPMRYTKFSPRSLIPPFPNSSSPVLPPGDLEQLADAFFLFFFLVRNQVWELSKCKLRTNHFGHTGYISTVTVSPDGSLCASGGKDGSKSTLSRRGLQVIPLTC